MEDGMKVRKRRGLGALLAVSIAAAAPAAGHAAVLPPFGSDLTATPSLDTANGATQANPNPSGPHAVIPAPHNADDAAFWNTTLPGGAPTTSSAAGQVLTIKVKGCALEDTSAPTQLSQGVPVNTINFQDETPTPSQGAGSVSVGLVAPYFKLPFCTNTSDPTSGAENTSTINTYHPVHMCIDAGQVVSFYDIGGFIPNNSGAGWYPQGVPFDVIAPVSGATMNSYVGAQGQKEYAPGGNPIPGDGFGTERGEEVMIQYTVGTVDDAYGLCPGGKANEPTDSNTVTCVYDNSPEPGATPCPGYGSGSSGGGGGGGTGGGGGGIYKLKPGTPTLTGGAFTGVSRKRPVISFTATAGANTGGVTQLTIPLTSGFAYAKRAATLIKGIVVKNGSAKLPFTARLSKGVLILTLKSPAPGATVTVSYPGLTCSSAEAKKVKLRHVQHIRLTVTVTEANGTSKTLTFRAPAR
jgi:hypothetical protein